MIVVREGNVKREKALSGSENRLLDKRAKQKGSLVTVGPRWSTVFVIPLSRIT